MRRKLWLLLILFLFLVGRESYCAQPQIQTNQFVSRFKFLKLLAAYKEFSEKHPNIINFAWFSIFTIIFSSAYWIFDLHQKKKGWYACRFFYAVGYRTKLFYKKIYLDFFTNFIFDFDHLPGGLLNFILYFIYMNINVRIYKNFYFVFRLPILPLLILGIAKVVGVFLPEYVQVYVQEDVQEDENS